MFKYTSRYEEHRAFHMQGKFLGSTAYAKLSPGNNKTPEEFVSSFSVLRGALND